MDSNEKVVLYSGGLDSTVLLWSLRPNVKALLCNYGQRHAVELEHAEEICQDNHIEYEIADLSGIHHLLSRGSQSGYEEVPEGHYAQDSMKTTIVPNRNAIMLSVAVGWAISTNCDEVYFAAHGGDHAIYPDCRPEFVSLFSDAIRSGNGWDKIQIKAPFLRWSKANIVQKGFEIGAPLGETWSCYKGGTAHCGKCGTCVERKEAFALAGVEDPTIYE